MSTIKKFEAIATNFYKQAVKTYSLEALTAHQSITQKNLYQKLSQYPGGGVHFRVRRKTWPKDMYTLVTEVNYKTSRTGNLFGKTFNRNSREEKVVPMRIRNGSKRSVWTYEIPEQGEIVLDNGMIYSMKEIKNIYQKRRTQQQQQQVSQQTNQTPQQSQEA